MIELKNAPFSFRITFRKGGEAAIIYRRMLDKRSRETLQRIVAVSPQAFAAGRGLFNAAVKDIRGNSNTVVSNGHHQSLDADWGARIACFGFVSSGLADPEKSTGQPSICSTPMDPRRPGGWGRSGTARPPALSEPCEYLWEPWEGRIETAIDTSRIEGDGVHRAGKDHPKEVLIEEWLPAAAIGVE